MTSNKAQSEKDNLASILKGIIDATPKIHIEKITPDGNISFCVKLSDINLTKDSVFSSRIIATRFFSNFLGEFLVRNNINEFAELLVSFDSKTYDSVITAFDHQNFGMFISKDNMKFEFHISLIENILNEDIYKMQITGEM